MKFRDATLSEIADLKKLEQSVVDAERPYNDSIKNKDAVYYDIENLITDPDSFLLVLEEAEQIIATGYGQLRDSKQSLIHSKHCYLGFMYVLPEYRGQGINKLILDKIMAWSKERGVSDFYLDVYSANDSAIKAYEKAGFQPSLLEMKLSL